MPKGSPKYTPEIHAALMKDLSAGLTRACACARAGIGLRTLERWLAKGRAGEEPYAAVLADLKKAERNAEARCVRIILKAARNTWQAAAWFLERKFPESWSKDQELLREIIAEYRKRKSEEKEHAMA